MESHRSQSSLAVAFIGSFLAAVLLVPGSVLGQSLSKQADQPLRQVFRIVVPPSTSTFSPAETLEATLSADNPVQTLDRQVFTVSSQSRLGLSVSLSVSDPVLSEQSPATALMTSLAVETQAVEGAPQSGAYKLGNLIPKANHYRGWNSVLEGAGRMNVVLTPEVRLSRSLQQKTPRGDFSQYLSVVTTEISEIP